jgi:hypothetical protein
VADAIRVIADTPGGSQPCGRAGLLGERCELM